MNGKKWNGRDEGEMFDIHLNWDKVMKAWNRAGSAYLFACIKNCLRIEKKKALGKIEMLKVKNKPNLTSFFQF